jgi:hypothetical protein
MRNNLRNINEAQVIEAWADVIKESLGQDISKSKLRWIAKVVNNQAKIDQAINEDIAIRGEVTGQGNYIFPTAGNQGTTPAGDGSGDTFKTLLPITMEVAGATVGFDIVTVYPIDGPGGVVPYIDYVYSNVYEAGDTKDTNEIIAFEFAWADGSSPVNFALGTTYTIASATGSIQLVYTGTDRLNVRKKHFKVSEKDANGKSIGEVVDGADLTINGVELDAAVASFATVLVNHVQGYTAPGAANTWNSNVNDGKTLFNPMSRGTGEKTQSKSIGLRAYTKPVDVGTISVDAKVTREQLKDLPTQFGIDIIALVKDVLIEELSQTINRHILSKAFALGWAHHDNVGKSLNLNISTGSADAVTYVRNDGTEATITVPNPSLFITEGQSMENQNTAHHRIQARVLAISNLIHKRGRRGPGNFVVTNLQVASALQASSKFSIAPMANTLTQTAMSLFQYGTISGMSVYVDPAMDWDDTRVLVGRKGAETEPGLKFVPYVLAESVEIIAESTMAPRIEMYSRYDLVEVGHHPETQYFTFFVKGPEGGLV